MFVKFVTAEWTAGIIFNFTDNDLKAQTSSSESEEEGKQVHPPVK